MLKSNRTIWMAMVMLVSGSLVLTACGGGAAPATSAPATVAPQPAQATQAPAEQPTDAPASSGKTTSSGFECPAPQNQIDVTSTELNLFVWTEYIPQDAIECFELVYGVKVNRKEYSSNEEMYASCRRGSTIYDLVQPTDYLVGLMMRQGLLQKLDKSKLPVLDNLRSELSQSAVRSEQRVHHPVSRRHRRDCVQRRYGQGCAEVVRRSVEVHRRRPHGVAGRFARRHRRDAVDAGLRREHERMRSSWPRRRLNWLNWPRASNSMTATAPRARSSRVMSIWVSPGQVKRSWLRRKTRLSSTCIPRKAPFCGRTITPCPRTRRIPMPLMPGSTTPCSRTCSG